MATLPESVDYTDKDLLTRETLARFVDIERPSSFIDGRYARAVATLRDHHTRAHQLVARIVADGEEHFNRFRRLQTVLARYGDPGKTPPYLRKIELGDPENVDVKKALELHRDIKEVLREGYQQGDLERSEHVLRAREAMHALDDIAEKLSAMGIGIPFFQ